MRAEERTRKQQELEKWIYGLSEKLFDDAPVQVRESALRLKEIYRGKFRHNYSAFFPIILDISKCENEFNLDYLSENLESLRAFAEEDYITGKKEFLDIYDNLEKLCDHLNLEIGRWNYYSKNEQKLEDLSKKTSTLNKDINSAKNVLVRASRQAASIQTELIAVLSIFAAIVITFSGGFTFLGSVMTSMENAAYYESVVMAAVICGLVMFNTIFLLMYLVAKITERNIYASCLTENCTCDQNDKKCSGLRRIRKRLPYVFYFNSVMAIILMIDLVVWYMDMKNMLGI